MTDGWTASACGWRPRPTGSPHVGLRPHGALQLGVRPAPRRHLRLPDRGHRQGAQHRGVLRRAARGHAVARPRLGRGPAQGRRPHAPYRQSERGDIYRDVLAQLRVDPFTYDCYCTTEEVDARRKASGSKVQGYDGFCRELSDEQVTAFEAEGRKPVVRFRMPDGSITWDDLVRGEITFETEHVPDFALCRANGEPLYTLVNPVDDALMEITHVLRGEDLLSSTPRQIALYEALIELGIAEARSRVRAPALRHGRGQQEAVASGTPRRTCSPTATTASCPRGCSTTWPCSAGRSRPTATSSPSTRWSTAFDIKDVNPNPARFDVKKADAINADAHADAVGRGAHPPGGAVPQGGGRPRRPGRTTPTPSCSSSRCRWSPSGSTS